MIEQRAAIEGVVHEVKDVRQGKRTDGSPDIYALKMRCDDVLFIPFYTDPVLTNDPVNCMLCIAEGPV